MLRKLVLKLACIPAKDREWIMSRLTRPQRSVVQDLLREVDDLGLCLDPAVVNSVLYEPTPRSLDRDMGSQDDEASELNLHQFWMSIAYPNGRLHANDRAINQAPELPAKLRHTVLNIIGKTDR